MVLGSIQIVVIFQNFLSFSQFLASLGQKWQFHLSNSYISKIFASFDTRNPTVAPILILEMVGRSIPIQVVFQIFSPGWDLRLTIIAGAYCSTQIGVASSQNGRTLKSMYLQRWYCRQVGVVSSQNGRTLNSHTTKVILQTIWGIFLPKWEDLKVFHTTKVILQTIWGTFLPKWEDFKLSYYKGYFADNLGYFPSKTERL